MHTIYIYIYIYIYTHTHMQTDGAVYARFNHVTEADYARMVKTTARCGGMC
jgi:hypothetical protein